MNRSFLAFSFGLTICAVLAMLGCEQDEPSNIGPSSVAEEHDDVRFLSNMVTDDNPQIEERRQQALKNITNDVVDPCPVLVFAILTRPVGATRIHIGLLAVDEDRDLLGIGLREVIHEDGREIVLLEEKYPAFAHLQWRTSHNLDLIRVPVRWREDGQKKDSQAWDDYVQRDMPAIPLSRWEYYRDTLPIVWLSPPQDNRVDVQVYVYDRAGHESEPVSLIYGPGSVHETH